MLFSEGSPSCILWYAIHLSIAHVYRSNPRVTGYTASGDQTFQTRVLENQVHVLSKWVVYEQM